MLASARARREATKAYRAAHPDPHQAAYERLETAHKLYSEPIASQIRRRPDNVTALGVVLHDGNVTTKAGTWRLRDCRISVTYGGGASGAAGLLVVEGPTGRPYERALRQPEMGTARMLASHVNALARTPRHPRMR